MIRSHLAQANRYIAEMKADIARERVILEHALDAGHPLSQRTEAVVESEWPELAHKLPPEKPLG